jgi:3-hydroxyacyl-CoA dehydrogenase/enoyl-CoA hydratase/3-hydroxybutyryl-CoA epimerase/3-hydroxyacyl-CoA dehydrogenase/enoyl-CoA hydratase/3-hydroxybutyryl-CoA epimerase/enoyl-CoA isomerase
VPHDAPSHPPKNRAQQRALENVRRLIEYNRADPGADAPCDELPEVASVGIIGGGAMGVAIAAGAAKHGLPVVIHDCDRRVLAEVPARVAAELAAEMPNDRAQDTVERLVRPTISIGPAARGDVVVETIVESYPAKSKLYAEIEDALPAATVLASTTSTISIGRLASGLSEPGRFCGVHYCHPIRERPLVEIVRGPRTADATVAVAVACVKDLGRMPVVVPDGPGFLVNRLLLPYLSESLELLLEGVTIDAIEQAAMDFGMALGPMRLLDEIGLDATLQGGLNLTAAFAERNAAAPLLVAMVQEGRTGRRAGRGFFVYGDPAAHHSPGAIANARRHALPDDSLAPLIAQCAKPAGQHNKHSITMRMFLPMLLEATRVLEERHVRDPRDIDLAAIFGLGFPAAQGGLLWWADTLGPARIVEMLRPMQPHGRRLQPTPLLQAMVRGAERFYRE